MIPMDCPNCKAKWMETEIMGEASAGGGYRLQCNICTFEWSDPNANFGDRATLRKMAKKFEQYVSSSMDPVDVLMEKNDNRDPIFFVDPSGNSTMIGSFDRGVAVPLFKDRVFSIEALWEGGMYYNLRIVEQETTSKSDTFYKRAIAAAKKYFGVGS